MGTVNDRTSKGHESLSRTGRRMQRQLHPWNEQMLLYNSRRAQGSHFSRFRPVIHELPSYAFQSAQREGDQSGAGRGGTQPLRIDLSKTSIVPDLSKIPKENTIGNGQTYAFRSFPAFLFRSHTTFPSSLFLRRSPS